MKILFAAPENAFGGFLGMIRSKLPQHHFEATGRFGIDILKGFDVLIPTMWSFAFLSRLKAGTSWTVMFSHQ